MKLTDPGSIPLRHIFFFNICGGGGGGGGGLGGGLLPPPHPPMMKIIEWLKPLLVSMKDLPGVGSVAFIWWIHVDLL